MSGTQSRAVLTTERLTLREMTLDDLDFLAELLADPEVMRFYPRTHTREESRRWLERQCERYATDGHGLWLVRLRDGDEPVGQVGLTLQLVEGERIPEVGYLIHRPYWRNGYATEAALTSRDFGFARGYSRVHSLVRPENTPSVGVARNLGMSPVRSVTYADIPHTLFAVDAPAA